MNNNITIIMNISISLTYIPFTISFINGIVFVEKKQNTKTVSIFVLFSSNYYLRCNVGLCKHERIRNERNLKKFDDEESTKRALVPLVRILSASLNQLDV